MAWHLPTSVNHAQFYVLHGIMQRAIGIGRCRTDFQSVRRGPASVDSAKVVRTDRNVRPTRKRSQSRVTPYVTVATATTRIQLPKLSGSRRKNCAVGVQYIAS